MKEATSVRHGRDDGFASQPPAPNLVRATRLSRGISDGLLRGYAVVAVLFLTLPLVLVALFSFTARPIAAFPFTGPSLKWYRDVLADEVVTHAILNSTKIALIAAFAATVVGSAAAYGVARMHGRRAFLASGVIGIPLIIPALLIAIALATALAELDVTLSVWTATLGQTILVLPLCFAIVSMRLASYDWAVEEASRDLGAGALHTFFHVIFPAIRPSVIGAMAIAMAFSLDEFVVTFFTIGLDATLPIVLWSRLRQDLDPGANALATLILAGTFVLITLAIRFGGVRLDADE